MRSREVFFDAAQVDRRGGVSAGNPSASLLRGDSGGGGCCAKMPVVYLPAEGVVPDYFSVQSVAGFISPK